jgi:biotin transporter BioY
MGMMKDHFNRFAVRFLTALLLGLVLLLLHGWSGSGVTGIFAPKFASPWELSKLAYWPLLGALLLTGWLSGGVKKTLACAAPCLVLTPLALFLVFCAVSLLEPAGGVYLLLWIVAAAIGLALADQERDAGRRNVWLVLVAAMAVLYVLFTFLPPVARPFLEPGDVATMGTIPY